MRTIIANRELYGEPSGRWVRPLTFTERIRVLLGFEVVAERGLIRVKGMGLGVRQRFGWRPPRKEEASR